VQTTEQIPLEELSREELQKIVLDQMAMLEVVHALTQKQIELINRYETSSQQQEVIIGMQAEQIESLKHLNSVLQFNHDKLKEDVARLKKWIHGSKTEKFVLTDNGAPQLQLGIEAEVVNACKVTDAKQISYVKTTTGASMVRQPRMWLSDKLRREEEVIEPANTTGLKKIGEDVTEILEYRPGELVVRRIIRPKYAKPGNSGVLMAPLPPRALEKHIFGESMLAQIIIDKHVDHLPLHRQIERYKRAGVNIPPSTMSDAVRNTYTLIEPLGKALLEEVLSTRYMGVDETPVQVLDRDKKGSTHRGYFWPYYDHMKKLVYFDYKEGRGREGPVEILKNYIGYLQCDGYGVYDIFEKNKAIVLLACMAHARRMFIEAQDNDHARAEYVLDEMQKLYAIEKQIKEQSVEERKRVRQEKSVPILNSLHAWMKEEYTKSLAKENDIKAGSNIYKALAYSLERWDKLSRYTEDGMLHIDNNLVENSIRPVKLGTKNYLFFGSHDAAKRSAMLYSLVFTCKLHGIDPLQYLTDVLKRISSHPINRIKELLPHNWKK
jgi:transposase